ncbi:hypothetical protein GGQ64_003178 [Rhizobium azooxidifex]|uniref:Uncharacterized protein n=1 Tax=Mycoplana azooxidifex TaxID=1636188 RepID=A0A7W6D8M2_9HYPH|nr:hypothetical protein [Mycoplana azooxidifex]
MRSGTLENLSADCHPKAKQAARRVNRAERRLSSNPDLPLVETRGKQAEHFRLLLPNS